jgi:hypothetical protein
MFGAGDHLDSTDEPVSSSEDGLDEMRIFLVIPQEQTQLVNAVVDDGFCADRTTRTPQPKLDLVASDELAVPISQENEQLHRLTLQGNDSSASAQFV